MISAMCHDSYSKKMQSTLGHSHSSKAVTALAESLRSVSAWSNSSLEFVKRTLLSVSVNLNDIYKHYNSKTNVSLIYLSRRPPPQRKSSYLKQGHLQYPGGFHPGAQL
jgi:hypothetical protein